MALSNDRSWTKSLLILFLLVLFGGCAPERVAKKEPFFEKWDTLAKESLGHSPVSNRRISVFPESTSKEGELKEDDGKEDGKNIDLPQERITLKMRQADVKAVLRALARASNKNILLRNEIKGEVDIDFTNVPWEQAFNSILRAQGLSYVWDGEIIRVLSLDDMEHSLKLSEIQGKHDAQAMEAKRVEPLVTMVISVDYADPQALRDNLQDFLTKDKDGKATMGSIKVDQGSNSLIIQASRDDINRMQPIIEKIDVPIHQINIKANIVETTKEIARNLGIQWGGINGQRIGNQGLFVTAGGQAGLATNPAGPYAGGYTPTSGLTGIAGQGFGVNFPAAGMDSTASASLGLIFGTIGGNILEAQLSALQKDSKLNILSSPSITTLNNQTAYTENGERVPYLSQETSGGAITNTVKFEDAVLRLEIKPHVIDNKTLKMDILVKKNQVDTTRNVQGNPFIIKKETKTSLIVQDGETIVISGLSKETNTYKTAGVPGLKSIPGLGWLFKNEGKADQMEEVLIFITPMILPPHVVSAAQPQEKELQAAP